MIIIKNEYAVKSIFYNTHSIHLSSRYWFRIVILPAFIPSSLLIHFSWLLFGTSTIPSCPSLKLKCSFLILFTLLTPSILPHYSHLWACTMNIMLWLWRRLGLTSHQNVERLQTVRSSFDSTECALCTTLLLWQAGCLISIHHCKYITDLLT